MANKKNRLELRVLMAEFELSSTDVSKLLDGDVTPATVRNYCAKTGLDIPDDRLKKLVSKLESEMETDQRV